jgi:hypothetical protein
MTHVFEGAPDARQSADIAMPTTRFRPKYRALTEDEKALHDAIKTKASELEALFEQARELRCPPLPMIEISDGETPELVEGLSFLDSPYQYFFDGMTALELAVMWTVKGLTA